MRLVIVQRVLAWFVVAVTLQTLSACTLIENYGPIQMSTVGGDMALAFCEEGTIESITVAQLAPGEKDRVNGWKLVWDARGPYKLVKGEVVVVNESTAGFASSSFSDVFEPTAGYEYEVNLLLDDGTSFGPVLTSPQRGLVQDTWLTSTGRVSSQPCE